MLQLVCNDYLEFPIHATLKISGKQRGLGKLKAAGINVILDHHALPGVQTTYASFAGLCTADPQFYASIPLSG